MKIHEYQAVRLFRDAQIPVPPGEVAESIEEANAIAGRVGFPLVLKSQVLVGGRGKAGGIKLVKSKEDFARLFGQLKGLSIKGYQVDKIFIVKAVDIRKEYYAAVTIDPARNDVVLIASSAGGVDIEETAKTSPEKIHKYYFHGREDIDPDKWKPFISAVFDSEDARRKGTEILRALMAVFFKCDCSLAEINPLVIDAGGCWIAADAKINIDDNALFRHPELQSLRDLKYEDPDEMEAKQYNLSFVKLDGDVGCVVNGAGLAMATMDVIKLLGGTPANFLDVGGSSNPEKVIHALEIILRNRSVKAILINIFGGITRCDDIANGILQALRKFSLKVPLVVRLTGTNEEQAKEILLKENIHTFSSMREAVARVVEFAKGREK